MLYCKSYSRHDQGQRPEFCPRFRTEQSHKRMMQAPVSITKLSYALYMYRVKKDTADSMFDWSTRARAGTRAQPARAPLRACAVNPHAHTREQGQASRATVNVAVDRRSRPRLHGEGKTVGVCLFKSCSLLQARSHHTCCRQARTPRPQATYVWGPSKNREGVMQTCRMWE